MTSLENIVKIWEKFWAESQAYLFQYDDISCRIAETILKIIPKIQGLKFLEAGSGSGLISAYLSLQGAEVTLLDISKSALDISQKIFKRQNIQAQMVCGNIFKMPFSEEVFDIVWNAGVIEHFHRDEQKFILKEMSRVTKVGGKIIIFAPSAKGIFYQLGKWWSEKKGRWKAGSEYPIRSLRSLAIEIGLKVENEFQICLKNQPTFALSSRFIEIFKKFVEILPDFLFEKIFGGYLIVTVCNKLHSTKDNGRKCFILRDSIRSSNSKSKNISHIISHYYPPIGGGENYVEDLFKIITSLGVNQMIYQQDSKKSYPFVRNVKKTFLIKNFNLNLYKYLYTLNKSNIIIIHDLQRFIPILSHKIIGVCHGVTWDNPSFNPKKNRRKKLKAVKAFQNALGIVANDTNFFREMGVDIKPAEKLFEEILPNRWFIPNCVDTNFFKKNRGLDQIKNMNPILVPRTVIPARGIHLAIEAFAYFTQKVDNVSLIIVGLCADLNYLLTILYNLIHEYSLIGKVFFLGKIDRSIMPYIYSSSLMSIIPSIYCEGTSLSALESMSCGTPTISTNIGGLRDLPTIQCEPTSQSIFEGMLEVYKNRTKIGEKQCEIVQKKYNINLWKEAWIKVLNKCLK